MNALECPQCGQLMFKWGSVYRCKNPNCKDVQMAEKLRLFKLTFDMLHKGLVIKGRKGQEGGEA
jgi:phage FluMu protein Com